MQLCACLVDTIAQGVARFYQDLVGSMANNLSFVVEEMTEGDPARVGVTWSVAFTIGNQLHVLFMVLSYGNVVIQPSCHMER